MVDVDLGGTTGIPITPVSTLEDLILYVRLKIGDITVGAYRYTDAWILVSLKAAVEFLAKWFNYKYLLNDSEDIIRNPNNSAAFIFDEDTYGIIEQGDKQLLVIAASYIILQGSLENSAWDFASWRDAEISYSNLESARSRSGTLARLWEELTSMLKPPVKRLAWPVKGTLPGYLQNQYERDITDP